MKRLLNQQKLAARLASGAQIVRIGTVSGYDPAAGAVKVVIQPDQVETGWIPLLSPWVGNGWGISAGPSLGDSVEVRFELGSTNAAFAGLRFYNDGQRPPPAPSGELWIVHQSGSRLCFTNDGDVTLATDRDLIANVGGNLNATVLGDLVANVTGALRATIGAAATITANLLEIIGNLTVTGLTTMAGFVTTAPTGGGSAGVIDGDLTATGTITGQTDVIAAGKSGKLHTHGGVQTGTGSTAPPT